MCSLPLFSPECVAVKLMSRKHLVEKETFKCKEMRKKFLNRITSLFSITISIRGVID